MGFPDLSDAVSRPRREGLEGKRVAGADGVWGEALRVKAVWVRSPVLRIAVARRRYPSVTFEALDRAARNLFEIIDSSALLLHHRAGRHALTAARRMEGC